METLANCIKSKLHLTDCDDDGYCNYCGNQDNEDYNQQTIFVVGYEDSTGWNSGGFYWFYEKKDATKKVKELKATINEDKGHEGSISYDIVYNGSLKVNGKHPDVITHEVEVYLELHDWENSFK